jgi:hypothetical protein
MSLSLTLTIFQTKLLDMEIHLRLSYHITISF